MSDIFQTQYGYHLLYVRDRGERLPDIEASHILIRVTENDTAAALAKIQQVDEALAAGESFAEAAGQFSEDPGSARQGGSLGMFGRGRMVPPFDEAAFGIDSVGGRSDWFLTRFGYHLVQLDSIGRLPTYDEAYDELKSLAQRLPRFKAAEEELAQEYKDRLGFTINDAVIDSLTTGYPADSVLHYFVLELNKDDSRPLEIASLGSKIFTIGDFLDYGMRHRQGMTGALDRSQLDRLVNQMLVDNALDVAAAALEVNDPEFAELMQEYRDGIVLFRVMEDSVWNRAASDSAGMEAHYEANAARYRFPERMRVVSLFAGSDSLLSEVADSWMPGDTTGLAEMFADDAKFRIDTTHIADTTNSIYDRALGREPGETVGPTGYRTGYMLLLIDGLEAPRPKTMEEARADVLGEYQQIVEDAWLARLRAKYNAVLYPENLESAFSEPPESSDSTTY
jgi:peptidyl-prolyl cis-trans isomerase SurA